VEDQRPPSMPMGRHKFTMCPAEIIICEHCRNEQEALYCRLGTDGLLPPCPEATEQHQSIFELYIFN
jgi:hypothetical protein